MKLIEGYRSFLLSLSLNDKNDLLFDTFTGKPATFTYNKVARRLALPTNAMIKKGMVDDTDAEVHAFHPLCEDVLRGESGTIRFLKRRIRQCFLTYTVTLVNEIVRIKSEKDQPRGSQFPKFLSTALDGVSKPLWDKKLIKSSELAANAIVDGDVAHMCNIYITNKAKIDGDMFLRVANTTTFIDELGEEGADFFSAKLERKIDKVVLYRLYSEIAGWLPQETGSNDACPYFGCLARMWHEYVRNYNAIVRAIKDFTILKPIPQDWFIIVNEMDRYRNVVPTLPYNTGPRDGSTAAPQHTEAYGLGGNTKQDLVPTAPLASASSSEGEVSIFDALGVSETANLAAPIQDLSQFTPAQQEALRRGEGYVLTSVLDKRLIEPEPVNKSLIDTVGLRNTQNTQPSSLDNLFATQNTSILDGFSNNPISIDGLTRGPTDNSSRTSIDRNFFKSGR